MSLNNYYLIFLLSRLFIFFTIFNVTEINSNFYIANFPARRFFVTTIYCRANLILFYVYVRYLYIEIWHGRIDR